MDDRQPRRRGRPAGESDAQAGILEAARTLFAQRGFAGTSIRAVAEAAAVDPALVHHYFTNKEGLFRAALQVPLDPEAVIGEIFAQGVEQAPARLVETFLRLWEGPQTGPAMVSFLRRTLADEAASGQIREFAAATILRLAADRLVGDLDRAEAEARLSLVISQMLGLVVLRKLLALEPLASMPADRLVAAVSPTIVRYLQGDLWGPAPDLLAEINQ